MKLVNENSIAKAPNIIENVPLILFIKYRSAIKMLKQFESFYLLNPYSFFIIKYFNVIH